MSWGSTGWVSSLITDFLDAFGQDIASFWSLVSLSVNTELRTAKIFYELLANLQGTS